MRKLMFLAALAVFCVQNGFAASVPKSSKSDSRITSQEYNAEDVTRLSAKDGFITTIALKSDERVIDMFTGFIDGWDIQDRANFVFIKPKAFVRSAGDIVFPKYPEWNTNLIITTNQRVYVFDLILVEKQQPIYKVNFNYPVDKIQEVKNQENRLIQQEITRRYNEEVNYIKDKLSNLNNPRNWNFYMKVNKESDNIAPVFAYDDGIFTYLGYDNTKSIPSVFLVEKGKESILNTHMKEQGEYQILVVHKVSPEIILRAGDKVVGIFNKGYGINPAPAGTTISKDVKREIK
ncbi:MAG: P-type conjugative transfer protein VirB9 [Campylobacteraceae bacterium]|jgi:type IV secretion system protein VirB9|nr:P-type conjugative transfer protein VirB9 [Campylobacteraceae bacterium]